MLWLRWRYGKDLPTRARLSLAELELPRHSLTYQMAMVNLEWSDLMDENAARIPEALELQSRVLSQAAEDPWAMQVATQMLAFAPIPKLFQALCRQALTDGSREIRVLFGETEINAEFKEGDQWRWVMTMPSSLGPPLRGHMMLHEKARLEPFRPFLHESLQSLRQIDFHWEAESVVFVLA